MSGSNPAFNAAVFRTNIKAAMQMGAPTATQDRVTFRWTSEKTYAFDDAANHPYSWTATPQTTTSHADVKVDVAVEFPGTDPHEFTSVGEINATKIIVTVLDEDYDDIQGADVIVYGQRTFNIDFVAPPLGLFEVTVYQIYASSEDLA